ncbi:HTH_48 domain-containing protein [Trichonephila clavipes]|nr:HTH_48 domain-containing protein [Trichonephila clavipes]
MSPSQVSFNSARDRLSSLVQIALLKILRTILILLRQRRRTENVHDEPRSGRPSVITDDLVNAVDEKIREDRRFTISTLALTFPNVGRTTLHKVVSEKLKFRKLCARWVPRLLTEEHKLKRMACALDFLDRYHKEGDQFLERIVTGDETWVSHITPESKRQSMQWRHTNSPVRVQAKWTISTRKVMANEFWDRPGVLFFGWEQIDHPPYSPDLAPSDFHLFRYLKEFLGGKRFDTADEVKEEVQDWLSSQVADVYELGIQKLVERYDKCFNKYGKAAIVGSMGTTNHHRTRGHNPHLVGENRDHDFYDQFFFGDHLSEPYLLPERLDGAKYLVSYSTSKRNCCREYRLLRNRRNSFRGYNEEESNDEDYNSEYDSSTEIDPDL